MSLAILFDEVGRGWFRELKSHSQKNQSGCFYTTRFTNGHQVRITRARNAANADLLKLWSVAANPCKFGLSLSLAGGFLKSPSVLVTNCQSSTMQGNKAGEGRHSCNGKRQSLANEVYEQLNPRKIPRKLAGDDDDEGRRWGKVSPRKRNWAWREKERGKVEFARAFPHSSFPSNRFPRPRKAITTLDILNSFSVGRAYAKAYRFMLIAFPFLVSRLFTSQLRRNLSGFALGLPLWTIFLQGPVSHFFSQTARPTENYRNTDQSTTSTTKKLSLLEIVDFFIHHLNLFKIACKLYFLNCILFLILYSPIKWHAILNKVLSVDNGSKMCL